MKEELILSFSNLFNLKQNEKRQITVLVFNPTKSSKNIELYFGNENHWMNLDNCRQSMTIGAKELKSGKCYITPKINGNTKLSLEVINAETNVTEAVLEQRIFIDFQGKKFIDMKQNLIEIWQDEKNFTGNFIFPEQTDSIDGSTRLFLVAKYEDNSKSWYMDIQKHLSLTNFDIKNFNITQNCNLKNWQTLKHISFLNYMRKSKLLQDDKFNAYSDVINVELNQMCLRIPFDGSIISEHAATLITNVVGDIKGSVKMTLLYLNAIKTFTKIMVESKINWTLAINSNYLSTSWLKKQMIKSGEIIENDPSFIYPDGYQFYNILVTALSYIAMQADSITYSQTKDMVNYLADAFEHLKSLSDKSICCFVLHLANHNLKDECFKDLIKSIKYDKETEQRYIEENGKVNLDATIFALNIMTTRKYYSIAYDIFKYIKSVQKPDFTIGNDFQTVLAMDSMALLAEQAIIYKNRDRKMSIFVNETKIVVDELSNMTLIHEIDPNLKNIDIKFNGFGKVNFYLAARYNSLVQHSNSKNETLSIYVCKE